MIQSKHVPSTYTCVACSAHQVVPMLPRLLCEELCSLNPDVDRLTFSVMWKMTEKGEVSGEPC